MKKKDIVILLAALLIFVVTGYIAITQLGLFGGGQSKTVQVEVAPVIEAGFSDSALHKLADPATVRDFTTPVDLSGLGNPSPFQPF